MLVKGDKIVLKKKMGIFNEIGAMCEVIDVDKDGNITFEYNNHVGGGLMGVMSYNEFEEYFFKYEEKDDNECDNCEHKGYCNTKNTVGKDLNKENDDCYGSDECGSTCSCDKYIEEMIACADMEVHKVFNKNYIVSLELPSGYIITEMCDLEFCKEEEAFDICLDKIHERLSEMENYRIITNDYELFDCEEEE